MNTNLSDRQRFLFAGVGGIMPTLLNLIVIDLETLLLSVTVLSLLSYLIRVLALFAIGGVVGWLNRGEGDPIKLFQLGIAAPALITAAMNGGRVSLPDAPAAPSPQSAWHIVSEAYARTEEDNRVKQFAMPEETSVQQIYRGFFGALPKNVWFVVVGSHLTQDAAEKQARHIRDNYPGFAADIYAPYGGNPYYAVVIGAQLTQQDARRLRQQAISAGFPKDTYLWTFPQR